MTPSVALLLVIVACARAVMPPINSFTVYGAFQHVSDEHHGDHCHSMSLQCSNQLGKAFMLVTKSPTMPHKFTSYLAAKGLHSIAEFGEVATYLKTHGDKYALFYDPNHFFNARFFNVPITQVDLGSFKLADIAHLTQHEHETMPILYFADAIDFEFFNFSGLKEIAKFNVYQDGIQLATI